jgi:serine/threonine protein phosphatase PrpC
MTRLRYAAGTDTGRRRQVNQDSMYASPRLLVVADGIGGQPHGEVASAAATSVMAELDLDLRSLDARDVDAEAALSSVTQRIGDRLEALADGNRDYRGMGTTLTALLWDGTGFGAVHVGDSRGYLVRGGVLQQLTRDHTLVQALVDDGRLAAEEAAGHPRRSMLMKALQSTGSSEPDRWRFDALSGDRYLLCSDGLTCVVTPDVIEGVLTTIDDPADAVARLIDLANEGGSPDNVTCVVADVVL